MTSATTWQVNPAGRSLSTLAADASSESTGCRRRAAAPRRLGTLRADRRRPGRGGRAHRGPHPRARQFGRPLSAFQAVQHSLAAMAGEIERARAATTLAVAAAADHGFDSAQADYAVTVAKVAVGRAVGPVTTIAHQLHGAIGVTIEHQLWLATMRARSWVDEFGATAYYARRLGRLALAAGDPWDSSSAVQQLVDPVHHVAKAGRGRCRTCLSARRPPERRCRSRSSPSPRPGGRPGCGRAGSIARRR